MNTNAEWEYTYKRRNTIGKIEKATWTGTVVAPDKKTATSYAIEAVKADGGIWRTIAATIHVVTAR